MERTSYWTPDRHVVEDITRWYSAGESCAEIGHRLGVDANRIYHQLKKAGVPRRSTSGAPRDVICRVCGGVFRSLSNKAQFCSKVCQYGQAECEWCGETFTKRPRPGRNGSGRMGSRYNVFCGRACEARGRRVPDDRRLSAEGYIITRLPDDWPFHGERYNGTMLEHRMVMSQALGRPLDPGESVHHINGDRADNRLENLQLRQGKHGRGSKFECLDCGSHNVGAVKL